MLLVGGFRVVDGALEVGALLAVVLYTRRFFDPMEEMAQFYNSYQSAAAALEKISGVLEEQPSVPDPTQPIDLWEARGAVDFDDVRFAYKARPDRAARRSTCTSPPGRRSRSSARPEPASRRSPSCSPGSTTRPPAA